MTHPPSRWTQAQAEAHLRSLELFGMRFGLERMRRLLTALDSPQLRFDSIHVLGTNGKTSTTRMIAAILERDGLRTGAYTSPHLVTYRERVQVGERELEPDAFAAAISRTAWAAERVNRTGSEDDHVTQFELLTAAALWAMAEEGVQVAVVEAGLGGRYDATSVIDASVTVLTNIGLEHTRWLGPTLRDIAEEKLAVVRGEATLVLPSDLVEPARMVAARVVRESGARVVQAGAVEHARPLLAKGAFQQRNFELARVAAEAYLERGGGHTRDAAPRRSSGGGAELARGTGSRGERECVRARHEQAVLDAGASTSVPGRLQVLDGEPLTVLDGAHNPDAASALAASLGAVIEGRPLALVLGVLDDKDAVGMLRALLPACERAWFTAPPSGRALPPATLESLARQLGFERASCVGEPARALHDARAWAHEHAGAVLATGSVYLVGDLMAKLHMSEGLDGRSRSARSGTIT